MRGSELVEEITEETILECHHATIDHATDTNLRGLGSGILRSSKTYLIRLDLMK